MASFPSSKQMSDLWKYIEKLFSSIKARPISGEHWKRVSAKFNQIVNLITSVREIAGSLFEKEMIDQDELESIQSLDSTPVRASTELLTVLMRKSKDAHDLFLETLIKTNQLHIYQLLTCEIEDCDMEHSRSIRTNYKWLVEHLDSAHGLIPRLIADGVLSVVAAAEVDTLNDPFKRNEKLLPIISRKDVATYRKFLEALRRTNQEHVVTKLEQRPQGSSNVTHGETKIFKVSYEEATPRPRRTTPPPSVPPHPPRQTAPQQHTDRKILKSPPATPIRRPPPPAPPAPPHPDRRSDPTPTKRRISVDSLGRIFSKLKEDADIQTSISMKVVTQKTRDSIVHSCVTKTFETMGIEKLIDNSDEGGDFAKFVRNSFMSGSSSLNDKYAKEIEMLKKKIQELQDKSSTAANQDQNSRIKQENVELNKRIRHLENLQEKNAELEAKIRQLLVFELRVKEMEKENSKKSDRTNEESSTHALQEENSRLRDQSKQYEDQQRELKRINENLEENLRKLKEKDKKSDGFQYIKKPFLEETIGRDESITGRRLANGLSRLTVLDDELYVVAQARCRVDVYGARDLVFRCSWSFDDVETVEDIAGCVNGRCLYIAFWSGPDEYEQVAWCDTRGRLLMRWSTGETQGRLSVTRRCRLLLTVCDKNKLLEYSPDGRMLLSVQLPSAVRRPQHAVEFEDGLYVVSYGSGETASAAVHGVCLVSRKGESLGSFPMDLSSPSTATAAAAALNLPVYLAVDGGGNVLVADLNNSRVLLLDSRLKFVRELVTDDHGLQFPRRICLDGPNGRLIVASGVAGSDGTGTGQVLVFRVGRR